MLLTFAGCVPPLCFMHDAFVTKRRIVVFFNMIVNVALVSDQQNGFGRRTLRLG